jgi:hypothetical protein
MPTDFQLSTDRGFAIENGRYGTVVGDAAIRQHIALAVLDVLARQQYGRLTEDVYADVRTALERRLRNHAQVEELVRVSFDRAAGPTTLKGEVVTDAVSVPFEEDL